MRSRYACPICGDVLNVQHHYTDGCKAVMPLDGWTVDRGSFKALFGHMQILGSIF
jgi:hypothetical protein